jgi:peroxiredoxin
MRQWLDPIAMALAAVAVVVAVGCPARQISRRTPRETPRPRTTTAPPAAAHASVAPLLSAMAIGQTGNQKMRERIKKSARRRPVLPVEPIPVDPNTVPTVELTEQLQGACWFKVGDEFPDLQLPSLDGAAKPLSGLTGGKLAVVVIWSPENVYAREEVADLPKLLEPYGDAVTAVAIGWGAPAEAVREAVEPLGLKYPVLVDTDRAGLPAKETLFLPQTYLLDADRKVIWFDVEYSSSTRRQLKKALRVTLGQ